MAATKIKKRQIENLQIADIDVAAAANIAISKIAGLQAALDSKEAAFTKNTAFNKNFGTTAGTVAEGNHTHDAAGIVSGVLAVARIPNLAIAKITGLQAALDGKEAAFSKNTAFNKNFGIAAGTVAEGNHTHTFASLTGKPTTIAGYGITDAYTKGEVDGITGSLSDLETTDKSNLVGAINEINGIVASGIKTPLPIDCSTNPDYPAAERGDSYRVTVAGKIGGVNGRVVEEGDLIVASVDTPAGDQATVGQNWGIYQSNIDKATEAVFGTGIIATAAQVTAGTNDQAWVTPAKLAGKLAGYVANATLDNYYTKANLQTSGQAQVNWGNVVGVPGDLGIQTLSLGALAGEISISDGNAVLLESLSYKSVPVFSDIPTLPGLYAINVSSGTGYPNAFGYGLLARRASAADNTAGSFFLWKSNPNDGVLQYSVGTGAGGGWTPFKTFASVEHVDANYLPLTAGPSHELTGQLISTAGEQAIKLNGLAATDNAYIGFYKSDGTTRIGYIGRVATQDHMVMVNDLAPNNEAIRILSTGGGNGLIYDYGQGQKTVWHEGNFTPSDYLLATSPAGSITQTDIDSWNGALVDIADLEQDVLTINQDIAAIETELDGVVSTAKYVAKEALTGAKDGVNKVFTLANAPVAGKEMIFLNGQLLYAGTNLDYTISGATVTLTANQEPPVSDDVILGTYIY